MAGFKALASAENFPAVRCPAVLHFELDYSTPTATYTIPVKAGTFVHQVGTVVTVAFDATSPSLTIGDGDDADGFLDSTDIALGTAATATTPAIKLAEDGGNPYANGKLYTADDTIDLVWDDGTSGTVGVLKGFILFSNVSMDGLATGTGATS